MAKIKINDLRKKSSSELETQIEELSKEKFNLRFQASNGQLTNTGRVKEVRKGIAKIKTILNERIDRE